MACYIFSDSRNDAYGGYEAFSFHVKLLSLLFSGHSAVVKHFFAQIKLKIPLSF